MKFIVDTQLPPKPAKHLNSTGYDCIHTSDFEDSYLLKDSEIILIATEENRTIITKDSDFSDHYYLKGAPPRVLLLQFGNICNKDLIAYFDKYFDVIAEAFKDGGNYVQFSRSGIVAD
jgi:predicted nuclease of predicted toxin-antitoxin system